MMAAIIGALAPRASRMQYTSECKSQYIGRARRCSRRAAVCVEPNRLGGIYDYDDDQRAQDLGGRAAAGTAAWRGGGHRRRARSGAAARRRRRADLRRVVLDRALDGGAAPPGTRDRRTGALSAATSSAPIYQRFSSDKPFTARPARPILTAAPPLWARQAIWQKVCWAA